MKKLLIAMAAASLTFAAFATEVSETKTTTVTFDSTKMKCGNQHITDGMSTDDFKKMKCKGYQDKKTDVLFTDDNSHKAVDCKIEQAKTVTLAKCTEV